VQSVRQPLGITHEAGRTRILAGADQDALARRPGSGDGMRLHMREQLLVNPVGSAAKRQFAQCRQVAG